jgi:hypothetical protein
VKKFKMENSAEFYYEKLKGSISPGAVIAALYCSSYGIEVGRSEIIMFNRLIRMFDRFLVYFAVMDMIGSLQTRPDEPYPYIYTICKRRFEAAHGDHSLQAREPLDRYLNDLNKQIEKAKSKKLKIPSTKGLEPNGTE